MPLHPLFRLLLLPATLLSAPSALTTFSALVSAGGTAQAAAPAQTTREYAAPSAQRVAGVNGRTATAFRADLGQSITVSDSGHSTLELPGQWLPRTFFTPSGLHGVHLDPVACTVKVWNLTTNQLVTRLEDNFNDVLHCKSRQPPLFDAALSSDGNTLLTTDGERLTRWDAKTGRLIHSRSGPYQRVTLSPNGRTAALWTGEDRLELWTADLRQRLKVTPPQPIGCAEGLAFGVTYAPDSLQLAFPCEGHVRIWHTSAGGMSTAAHPDTTSRATQVAFSRDGRWLIAGTGLASIDIWNAAETKPQRRVSWGGDAVVSDLTVAAGNVLLAALSDGRLITVRLDSTAPYTVTRLFSDRPSLQPSLASDPTEARYAAADGLGTLKVRDVPPSAP